MSDISLSFGSNNSANIIIKSNNCKIGEEYYPTTTTTTTNTTTTTPFVDTLPPVITISGPNPFYHEVLTPYNDPGATAYDQYFGDISVNVIDDVCANVVGTYTVTYNAYDPCGNQAIPKIRTVNVLDNIEPVITINGDVSLNIEVFTPYVEAGATITDNYDSSIVIDVSGTVDISNLGVYHIYYNATDSYGNHAKQKIRTITVIDTISPIITIIGPNPLDIKYGHPYIEYGATAVDQYFGILSVDISSNVDTAIDGSYQIIYSASDPCGNDAIAVRIVNVLPADFTFPVILINWQNLKFNVNLDFGGTTRVPLFSDVYNLLNDINYNYPGINDTEPTGSVKTYYNAISHGQMNVQFDILNASITNPIPNNQLTDLDSYAYEISNNYQDNGDANDHMQYPPAPALWSQLSNAYNQAINNFGGTNDLITNYNKFTSKYGNNLGVTFIHAGYGAENGSNFTDYIWSHKWVFIDNQLNALINYNINPFKNPTSGTPKIVTIGVIAHESLHSFGVPDLYDIDYTSMGAGRSSIMASGSWGYLDPYSTPWLPTFANTWTRNELTSFFNTNIITITSDKSNLILPSINLENKSYRIDHPDPLVYDYWLIEYRTTTGFNRNLPNGINGLAIWHINPSRTDNNNEIPIHRRGESGYMVGLEQYDGSFNLESGDSSQGGDIWPIWPNYTTKEFSPYTVPSTVSSSGIPSGIKLYNIALMGNDVQFDVTFLPLNPQKQISNISYSNFNTTYQGSNGNIIVNNAETINITTINMIGIVLELTLNNNPNSLQSITINNNTESIIISNMIQNYGRFGFNIMNIYDPTHQAYIWNDHFQIIFE